MMHSGSQLAKIGGIWDIPVWGRGSLITEVLSTVKLAVKWALNVVLDLLEQI